MNLNPINKDKTNEGIIKFMKFIKRLKLPNDIDNYAKNNTPNPFKTTSSPVINHDINESKENARKYINTLPINETLAIVLKILKTKQKNPSCIHDAQVSELKNIIIDSPTNDLSTPEKLIKRLEELLRENNNVTDLTRIEKSALSQLNTTNLWQTLYNLSLPRLKNNSKFSTQYSPGWSYMPPSLWETNKNKVPVCRNTKEVSGPAFVFGDGVPANALELDDELSSSGAGTVGSMMPDFTFREMSDDWSDGSLTSNEFDNVRIQQKRQQEEGIKRDNQNIKMHNYLVNKRIVNEEILPNLKNISNNANQNSISNSIKKLDSLFKNTVQSS